MTRTLLTALTATLAGAFLAPLASAQIAFDRIAPENSIFVAGVHNANTTRARFERTALHNLWKSDELRELRRGFMEGFDEGLADAMRELGVEREDFVWPTGAVGFALFAVIDPEIGMPSPAYVLFADYGDRADNFQRIITAALNRGRDDGDLEIEEREIFNRSVLTITFADAPAADDWGMEDEKEDDWGFEEDDWGFGDDPFGFGMGDPFADFRTLHLVREGGAFILCSDLGSITEVLDRIDNERASGLAERADFRNALNLIGANDGYAVVLTRDMGQLIQAVDPTGMAMDMVTPMLQSLFGDIEAMSTGVLFDAPEAMVRNNFAVAMPRGKRGLSALIDVSKPRGPLPTFVGEGAYSYSVFNFAFGRVLDVAKQLVAENPMLAMMGAAEMLEGVEPMLQPVFGSLGDRIHMVGSLKRPITAESMETLVAIESTNPQQLDAVISGFAQQYGMEAQDFNGHRLYASPPMMMPGMMMPAMPEMALGIGAGHVFIGGRAAVEQALTGAAAADRPAAGLAQNPQFAAAVRRVPDVPLVTWQYADLVTTIEATIKANMQMMEQMREQFPWMEEMDEMDGMDDPFGDIGAALEKIDFDLLRRYLGPSVSWMRSTEAGFVGTSLYFSADQVRE